MLPPSVHSSQRHGEILFQKPVDLGRLSALVYKQLFGGGSETWRIQCWIRLSVSLTWSALLAALPSHPLRSQVQDGLLPCRTALTPCLGVEKDEQLFVLYKCVLLGVCRSQGHGTRQWGGRDIAALPD